MDEVSRWVRTLGVHVVHTSLSDIYGGYMVDYHAVVISTELGPVQYRSTMMHELGHAFHRHESTTIRAEREAGEWAARAMIRGCEYAKLIRVYDNTQDVASELGVLPRDVVNFAQWLARDYPNVMGSYLD